MGALAGFPITCLGGVVHLAPVSASALRAELSSYDTRLALPRGSRLEGTISRISNGIVLVFLTSQVYQ